METRSNLTTKRQATNHLARAEGARVAHLRRESPEAAGGDASVGDAAAKQRIACTTSAGDSDSDDAALEVGDARRRAAAGAVGGAVMSGSFSGSMRL